MKKNLSSIAIIICFASLFWLALLPAPSCMASPVDETKETITMSLEQYNKYLNTLKEQEKVLQKAKRKMEMLEMPLTEQMQLLEKCENELFEARSNLEKQEVSLTRLSNSIEVLKQDLKILQGQIKKIEQVSKRRARQRDFYVAAFSILSGIILVF